MHGTAITFIDAQKHSNVLPVFAALLQGGGVSDRPDASVK